MNRPRWLTLGEYAALDAGARVAYIRAQRVWLVELQAELGEQRQLTIAKRYELEDRRRKLRQRSTLDFSSL